MYAGTFQERFLDLRHRYVHRLTIRGPRATGLCPFHQERNPSFSANTERGVFLCFGCGTSGGVKKFAELVGEAWESRRGESRAAKACRARFHAEQQARGILQRRAEERDRQRCAEHRELHGEAVWLADLLAIFHHRPHLVAEFLDLAARTEHEYGEAVFQRCVLEAQLDGEVRW